VSAVPLARKSFRDVRVAAIAVGLVSFAIALLDVIIYPQYRESLEDVAFGSFLDAFLGEAGSITSPAGFLSVEFFAWIPLLLVTVAIIGGTAATAGEEAAGTLDLLLAQPVSRRRLLLEKTAGLTLAIALAALISFPGFLIGKSFVPELTLGPWRLFEAVANMLPLALIFLALSLWAGASLPGRGPAVLAVMGVVVVTYFLNSVGSMVGSLDLLRKFSPFYWGDGSRVLVKGFDFARAGGLLGVAALFLSLAAIQFERRDIASGRREWSLRGVLRRRPAAGRELATAVGTTTGPRRA
jgi:ABC-2 type transport system permease protein